MWIIFIILGVVLEILKANSILIIPVAIEYVVFGLGIFLLLIQIITYFVLGKHQNRMMKRFKDRFDRF